MHIFVTGGTGFFGKALLRHWASGAEPELAGARFTLLSRDPERFTAEHGELLRGLDVSLHRGDILDAGSLPKVGDFSHVLHAATDSTQGLALTPLQRFEQISSGTRNILDWAVRLRIPRLLMTSSGGVYGRQPADCERIGEDWTGMPDPMEPQNAYSLAKRVAEHLCALYHEAYGIETVIARCFAFVGEDLPLDAHFAIGNFMRDALAGRDITVQGDGSPLRSYLDQRDLAHWLSVMLLRGQARRAYNVGSDQAISIAELAALVARLGGQSAAVRILGQAGSGQSAERNRYVPDVSRAGSELGLTVTIPLEDALRHALARIAG